MPGDDIGMLMFQELIEKHRNDYEGAVVKIEEWRGLINILGRFTEIARDHPDGWEHVMKIMQERAEGEGEQEEG